VGIVVDGIAEYAALPLLLPRVAAHSGHTYKVIKADIQPLAPLPAIARTCRQPVIQLEARGIDLVVVLFDRETRTECPADIARVVGDEIGSYSRCRVVVVIKDRKFENWLVSDLSAMGRHPARFRVSQRHTRAVVPNRADAADAIALLRTIVRGTYAKVDDGKLILEAADPTRMGRHSRSFRKFLREAGHPAYRVQSKLPA